jgi:hypothetical protein
VIVKVLFVLLKIRCFMRDQSTLTSGIILFEMLFRKIHTRDNPAEMMTKPVPTAKFELCSILIGIKV